MEQGKVEKYKRELEALVTKGKLMLLDLTLRDEASRAKLTKEKEQLRQKVADTFETNYQRWYTEASAVIAQLLPTRLDEFRKYYEADGKRKSVTSTTFAIQDWLLGIRAAEDYAGRKYFSDLAAVTMRLQTQVAILTSASAAFESSLLALRQVLQADLFDSELDAANELKKAGFLRASGTVAGVVLEKHLASVCASRGIAVRKKAPTIGDLNDLLKENTVVDVPTWRFVQRLTDLRNLCAHNRDREPTSDEVAELVQGVAKASKTIY